MTTDTASLNKIIYGHEDEHLLALYSSLSKLADANALSPDESRMWVAVNRRLEMLTGGSTNTPFYEALRGALNGWDPELVGGAG